MPDLTDAEIFAELDRIYTAGGFTPLDDDDQMAYIRMASEMPETAQRIKLDRDSYDEWIADTICLIAEVRQLRARVDAMTFRYDPTERKD